MKESPKIFEEKLPEKLSDPRLDKDVVFGNKQLSDYFEKYKTTYPFDFEEYKKMLDKEILSRSLLVHEPYFFWFGDCYKNYVATYMCLFDHSDFLTLQWKLYISIMAVSTLRCEYLLSFLETEFILKSGELSWLTSGLSKVPEKLQKLSKINNILAHQPWNLTQKDLQDLFDSAWNKEELIEAVLILVFFHRVASINESMKFSFQESDSEIEEITKLIDNTKSCEKNPLFNFLTVINNPDSPEWEDDEDTGKKNSKGDITRQDSEKDEEAEVELPMDTSQAPLTKKTHKEPHRKSKREHLKIKKEMKIEDDESSIQSDRQSRRSKFVNSALIHMSSYCTKYSDFDLYSHSYLHSMVFNWAEEGYYILTNICAKEIEIFNNEMDYIFNLTSNTIGGGEKRIDTFHFRNTIRCYIEKIFGIVNDDFNYSQVGLLN